MERREAVERLQRLTPPQLDLVHFLLEVDVSLLPGPNEALATRVIALYRLLEQDARKLARLPVVLDDVILGHSSRATQHHAWVNEALSRLDFTAQVRAFRDIVETQRLCAFVIHGPPETGHVWLLNRLKLLLPRRGMQAKKIFHSCAQRTRRPGVDAILGTLRRGLGFDVTATPVEELARRACKIRETQDLLLIIDAVESLDDGHVLDLVERFWGAVVDADGHEAGERRDGFHLLLFLLCHAEQEAGWAGSCADCTTGTWQPRVPIKLPRLASFPADLLRGWIETHTDTLPRPLRDAAVAAELFARCEQGLPLLVFEDICRKWLAELEEREAAVIFDKLDRRWWRLEA